MSLVPRKFDGVTWFERAKSAIKAYQEMLRKRSSEERLKRLKVIEKELEALTKKLKEAWYISSSQVYLPKSPSCKWLKFT